jgi:hypothetical protein
MPRSRLHAPDAEFHDNPRIRAGGFFGRTFAFGCPVVTMRLPLCETSFAPSCVPALASHAPSRPVSSSRSDASLL